MGFSFPLFSFFIAVVNMKHIAIAKHPQVLVLVLLCLLVLHQEVAEGRTIRGGFEAKASSSSMSTKIVEELARHAHRFEMVDGHEVGLETWELRNVPAGPDPLHHHRGTTPNKPRTP